MAEYIDREALMQKMLTKLRDWKQKQVDYDSFVSGYAQGCIDVENAPTAEVTEVKHGEWIEFEDNILDTLYQCSVCKEEFVLIEGTPSENLWKYCPNCGARMDGKEKDDE
jgi:DNA-directed RNA polymerase subunit RPC12/RpoP